MGAILRRCAFWEPEKLLLRGGTTEVYKAWDLTLERHVAIKLIHTALAGDPDFSRDTYLIQNSG